MADEVPPWLDEAFLATVLQDGDPSGPRVVVDGFTVTPAVAKGNNYMSAVYRVRARYTEGGGRGGDEESAKENSKTAALILKAPLTNGKLSEYHEKMNIPEVEPRMYEEVLPEINEMLGCQLNPKRFYCPLKNGMALADLSACGYATCDKRRQLDFAHCESALSTLGRLHAASVRLRRLRPAIPDDLGRERSFVEGGFFSGENRAWITRGVAVLASIADTLPGCQEIAKYMLGRAEELPESLVELCKPRTDGLNVLNHGDLWLNNILYKHDHQSNIEDIKLIDFQMVRWASPVLDIQQFIWTSADEGGRSRVGELLSTYLRSLNDTLERLGCEERLSTKELESEMAASSDWPIFVLSCTLPLMMCDPEDAPDMSDEAEEVVGPEALEKTLKSLFGGKTFNSILPALLRQLQQWLLLPSLDESK